MLQQDRYAVKPERPPAPTAGGVDSCNTPVTRRDFLRTSGMAAGALIALSTVDRVMAQSAPTPPPTAPPGAPPLPLVVGVVEGLDQPGTLRVRSRQAGLLPVRVATNALILRGVRGADRRLDAFRPGDAVVAEGNWAGTTFTAHTIESAFRVLAGAVQQRHGDTLTVTGEHVVLRGETLIFTGYGFLDTTLEALAVGDEVVLAAWYDPDAAVTVVARVALVQRAR